MDKLEEIKNNLKENKKIIENMKVKELTLNEQRFIYLQLEKRLNELEKDKAAIIRNGYLEKDCINENYGIEKIQNLLKKFREE